MLNTTKRSKMTTKPAGRFTDMSGQRGRGPGDTQKLELKAIHETWATKLSLRGDCCGCLGLPPPARIRPYASDQRRALESSVSPGSSPPDRTEHTPVSLSGPCMSAFPPVTRLCPLASRGTPFPSPPAPSRRLSLLTHCGIHSLVP